MVRQRRMRQPSAHPEIIKFLSTHGGMIILERLQCPLRKRLRHLRGASQAPSAEDIQSWAFGLSSRTPACKIKGRENHWDSVESVEIAKPEIGNEPRGHGILSRDTILI
ncbi:hypothetical protein CIHG_10065 [Coccidioides immitis H538.4]|uniref:Uncharacterized protein n=3 Tax=Coccidioides immitis TaxID=5501 RepID=A0A0J8R8L6_COCIT|nr:hypothetical protein CIRG_05159 [Coccidioides immitis RMSCC 2394]KMU81369.1 hypothetical protein CISG_09057 [Coccidioides immitis RMSCC 3703]KMU92219.1 hypothetical protein CIHG_10065 [Coccidioides immitis H538.4]